ncbi:MAG: hypothetical protein KDD73_05350 [Anaerolineales bacterium]|nr:hypothetical protein [Anaerolineales bacterium]MCB9127870.1 hypothetical protein [Ardenticatenales bacterium]
MSPFAIIFIIIAVIAGSSSVVLLELRRLVQDRPLIKRLLDGQRLLADIFPATARSTPTQPLTGNEQEVLRNAIHRLLPAGWATGESDKAVDAIYAYLDDDTMDEPDLAIELGPLLSAIDGREGREAFGSIIDTLPNCPGRSRTPPPPGLLGLPSCVPEGMSRRQVVRQVQKSLSREVTKYLRRSGSGSTLSLAELQNVLPTENAQGETANLRDGLFDLRRGVKQVRRFSWIMPLIAVAAIALALEFSGIEGWKMVTVAGWPLLVTGIVVLIILAVLAFRLRGQFAKMNAAVRAWLGAVVTMVQRRLLIWSAALIVIGAVLLLVGNSL